MYPIWHPYATAQDGPPLCVHTAKGSLLTLRDGNVLIDAIGSWWTSLFGHSYPPLVHAMQKQAEELDHVLFGSTTHEPAQKVANLLVHMLGPGKVIFSDNGSTAIEIGMKLACQLATLQENDAKTLFASFEGGYHGDTIGAMGLQGESVFTKPYRTCLRNGISIPFVETWHNDTTVELREEKALALLDDILEKDGKKILAFVFEPLIQGSSGMRMCRPEFLQAVTQRMKDHHIMLIADEVMTGLGRTGELFACTKANIDWDIVALSKGLVGGMLPLAVTFIKSELFDQFFAYNASLLHGHTFTANPIACAVAAKTLEILLENKALFQNFESRYSTFNEHLQHTLKHIRSLGCIWAGNIPQSWPYGSAESIALRKLCIEKGILVRPIGSVIYLLPAYTISDDELQKCFLTIEEIAHIYKE